MHIIFTTLRFCRAKFLPVVIFPVLAGYVFGYRSSDCRDFNLSGLLVLLFAAAIIHLFANGINDYFDYRAGLETLIRDELGQDRNDEQGGSKLLSNNIISLHTAEKILIFLIMLIAVSGLYILLTVDWKITGFGAAGIILGCFYTAPPFRLSYRGIGEIIIFICFGILPFLTGFYFIKEDIDAIAFLPASVFGLLTVLILFFHHFGHWRQDKKKGKKNLIVIIGPEWGIRLFKFLVFLIIILIALNSYLGIFNYFSMTLFIPMLILIRRAGSIDLENYSEVIKFLKEIIMSNFIASAVLILALLLDSRY